MLKRKRKPKSIIMKYNFKLKQLRSMWKSIFCTSSQRKIDTEKDDLSTVPEPDGFKSLS